MTNPETVARDLVEGLIEYGFHGGEDCLLRHEPHGMLRVNTSFADTDTQRTVVLRIIGQIARKNGYVVHTYNFVDNEVVLHEDI